MTLISEGIAASQGASALQQYRDMTGNQSATAEDMFNSLKGDKGDKGDSSTQAQVDASVGTYLAAHPPAAGQNATDSQVSGAVSSYLAAHPPSPGANATDAQVLSAVTAYIAAHPPAAGKDGIVPVYLQGSDGKFTLQVNVVELTIPTVTDASGNWAVDYTAMNLKKVLDVYGTAWKDTDVAVDQVDVRYKKYSLTAASGSVVSGKVVTSLLVTSGAPPVAKVAAGVPINVIVKGLV